MQRATSRIDVLIPAASPKANVVTVSSYPNPPDPRDAIAFFGKTAKGSSLLTDSFLHQTGGVFLPGDDIGNLIRNINNNAKHGEGGAMFSKNMRFYRLKARMTKKALAEACGVTPMAITHYEAGDRRPSMDTLLRISSALDVTLADLLRRRHPLSFEHGGFRKGSVMSATAQQFVRESVEDNRSTNTRDMEMVAREYGVSMMLLSKSCSRRPCPPPRAS